MRSMRASAPSISSSDTVSLGGSTAAGSRTSSGQRIAWRTIASSRSRSSPRRSRPDGYYLVPDGQVAAKPYKLLRQALGRSSKVAIAKYAWSGRERLGLLRVRENAIVLHAMRWPDEVRDPAAVDPPDEQVSEKEIEGALALIDS